MTKLGKDIIVALREAKEKGLLTLRTSQEGYVNAEEIFKNLDDETIRKLDIDEIKERLRPLMGGLVVTTPILPKGTFVYRARKFDSTFKKKSPIKKEDLIYPPSDKATLGRANRNKQCVFYCSLAKEPIFFELLDLKRKDELIITFWQTTEKMVVNNIGYTQKLFEQLGAKRTCPTWTGKNNHQDQYEYSINENSIPNNIKDYIYNQDQNKIVREAMSNAFMRHVHNNNSYLYKLSVALAELHLGEIANYNHQFNGILYPSLRVGAEGDNLALLPDFVDNNLMIKKAVHIRIEDKQDKHVKITSLDHGKSFSEDGILQWLGRLPQWNFQGNQEIECRVVEGVDDDGDYQVNQNGARCHWAITDTKTGTIIKPK